VSLQDKLSARADRPVAMDSGPGPLGRPGMTA